MTQSRFYRLTVFTVFLAFCVIMLGAYTRLGDAGLGCPDWPGCYGHIDVPQTEHEIAAAQEAYPERPVEAPKAWKEMVHRYFAGTLGLMIGALFLIRMFSQRIEVPGKALPTMLLGLVIFQALLGMWTVTLLLKPVVVMGHLLGGFATLSLLWWMVASQRHWFAYDGDRIASLKGLAWTGLVVLIAQISLGGWTSTNYAALACTDFPTCHGSWWPDADFGEAFVLWRGLGIDYEFGVLDNPARVAIHLTHRIGALITFLLLAFVAWRTWSVSAGSGRNLATVIAVLLLTQVSLGITNVLAHLPIGIAVAHNAVGALLLLSMVTLVHTASRRRL